MPRGRQKQVVPGSGVGLKATLLELPRSTDIKAEEETQEIW